MRWSLVDRRRLTPAVCLLAAASLLPFPAGARAQEPASPAPGHDQNPPPASNQAPPSAPPSTPTPAPASTQTPAPPSTPGPGSLPAVSEKIEVTATRVPEDVEPVPASITVIGGEDLQARGATDLAGALATAARGAVAPRRDK